MGAVEVRLFFERRHRVRIAVAIRHHVRQNGRLKGVSLRLREHHVDRTDRSISTSVLTTDDGRRWLVAAVLPCGDGHCSPNEARNCGNPIPTRNPPLRRIRHALGGAAVEQTAMLDILLRPLRVLADGLGLSPVGAFIVIGTLVFGAFAQWRFQHAHHGPHDHDDD
jgi:hypothetical protein